MSKSHKLHISSTGCNQLSKDGRDSRTVEVSADMNSFKHRARMKAEFTFRLDSDNGCLWIETDYGSLRVDLKAV